MPREVGDRGYLGVERGEDEEAADEGAVCAFVFAFVSAYVFVIVFVQ